MSSLKATREAQMFGDCEGWLDDIVFVVLTELNTSENLDFPYGCYNQFKLDDMDEAECIAEFRYQKGATNPCFDEVQPKISFHWNVRTLYALEKG